MLDATPPLQYPGIPMSRFGLIPKEYGGGNKYRLIWAPSRMVVLTGRDCTMTVPLYHGPRALVPVGEFWVLEGWMSPLELCGSMTEKEWNADQGMLNTGPYPSKGRYEHRETLSCNPIEANIEKLIAWIEAGSNRRSGDNLRACQENMEYDIRDRQNKRRALIKDAMRPFGAEAMVGYGSGRGTKNYPVIKSREELGLPAQGVTKAVKHKPVIYEIPQEW